MTPALRAPSSSARQGAIAALSSATSLPSDSPKPPGQKVALHVDDE
jgi:hypothetical protein